MEKSWPSTWIPVKWLHRPRTQQWKGRLHLSLKKTPAGPLQVHPTNISLIILQSDQWPFTRVIVYGEKKKTKILEIHLIWILILNHYQEITNISYCLWLEKKVWRTGDKWDFGPNPPHSGTSSCFPINWVYNWNKLRRWKPLTCVPWISKLETLW